MWDKTKKAFIGASFWLLASALIVLCVALPVWTHLHSDVGGVIGADLLFLSLACGILAWIAGVIDYYW